MRRSISVLCVTGLASVAAAGPVQLRVSVRNMAPANSVSFAPLRVGFHNGTFDAFDNGQAAFLLGNPDIASAPIVTIAEGGSGSTWFPAFLSIEPNAVFGSVLPNPAGPLLPGATGTAEFTVDPSVNRFFTFGSMVVPSNDHFIGNDNPIELFDAMGNLSLSFISQFGRSIWDAGSETTDPANAAFLVGGVNANRVDQNGVVTFNSSELDAYNGLTTAAGYVFDRQFGAADEIYRISFEIVPAPATLAFFGLGVVGVGRRRTR